MPRHSFIHMSKLPDLKGRISYIASPDRQENLFAVYDTADTEFWTWALAEWKQQVEGKPAEEKKPPERKSVLAQLHRIRDEAQKPPKRSSRDRDER